MSMISDRSTQIPEALALANDGHFSTATRRVQKDMFMNTASGLPYFLQFSDWTLWSVALVVNFIVHKFNGSLWPIVTGETDEDRQTETDRWRQTDGDRRTETDRRRQTDGDRQTVTDRRTQTDGVRQMDTLALSGSP